MSHEIKILSAYNGRLHETTVRRAEHLIGIEVDGDVVYFDQPVAKEYGVTLEGEDNGNVCNKKNGSLRKLRRQR